MEYNVGFQSNEAGLFEVVESYLKLETAAESWET